MLKSTTANDGKTLNRAVEVGNLASVKLLLEWGADVNIEDNDQATPLLTAVKGEAIDTSRATLYEITLRLLQQPAIDVNSRSSSALQEAIAQNQTEIAEAMLAHNVHVNAQGSRYGGAVQAAVCRPS